MFVSPYKRNCYNVDKGLFGLFIFFKHSVKSILPLKAKKIKLKSKVFFVFQTGFLVITNWLGVIWSFNNHVYIFLNVGVFFLGDDLVF